MQEGYLAKWGWCWPSMCPCRGCHWNHLYYTGKQKSSCMLESLSWSVMNNAAKSEEAGRLLRLVWLLQGSSWGNESRWKWCPWLQLWDDDGGRRADSDSVTPARDLRAPYGSAHCYCKRGRDREREIERHCWTLYCLFICPLLNI